MLFRYVNDVAVKIKGVANHQDFAGVGVAVPDKLQVYVVRRVLIAGPRQLTHCACTV